MLPKLRVWLKERHIAGIRNNKKYYIPKGMYEYIAIFADNPKIQNLQGAVMLYVENDDAIDKYFEVLVHPKDVEIMQYTGIKDKCGNEIWEGDIIEWEYWHVCGLNRGIVECQPDYDGYFGVYHMHFNSFDYNTIKVLGNKYENPELLKEV
jgi:uncharacterized phage protein (TIGR01671 family)